MKKPTIIYMFYGIRDPFYPGANSIVPNVGHTVQLERKNWIVTSVRHYLDPHENCIRITCLPFDN